MRCYTWEGGWIKASNCRLVICFSNVVRVIQKTKLNIKNNKLSGAGLNLCFDHLDDILRLNPPLWFEIIAEELLEKQGDDNDSNDHRVLQIAQHHNVVIHSLSLNLGGVDSIDRSYLSKLARLYDLYQPVIISDHICFSKYQGYHHHDLLPIPKTKTSLKHLSARINHVQDYFGRQLVLENISHYIDYKNQTFNDIEFIMEIINLTNCGVLLDISNALINHHNRGLSVQQFFGDFPLSEVKYIHLSGGSYLDSIKIDSHSTDVEVEDISILKMIYDQGYKIPFMIERNQQITDFHSIYQQLRSIEMMII